MRATEAIDVITVHERHSTPEQLRALQRPRREPGGDAIRRVQEGWAELVAAVEAER